MRSTLLDLLKIEHIQVGVEAADAQDVIRKLSVPFIETGHVAPEFADDVWQREQTFPTGLPTQPLAVAIPHADPDHVNKSGVCVGVLRSPIRFAQMGTDGSTSLDVRVVFLLAVKEKEKQVEMIRQLMLLIQSPSLVEGLSKARDSSAAMALIQNILA